jgi:hypothetical protein
MLLEMTMYKHGYQINPSLNQYQITSVQVNNCGFTMPVLIVKYFGMSYVKTSAYQNPNSSSLYALLHKRVQIAYLARLKTLAAQSQVACEKTTEEASLSDYFPSLVLMDRLTIRRS